jgi:hypothetical protein
VGLKKKKAKKNIKKKRKENQNTKQFEKPKPQKQSQRQTKNRMERYNNNLASTTIRLMIYQIVSSYYENPLLQLLKEKTVPSSEFSIYICKIKNISLKKKKYIIVKVPTRLTPDHSEKINLSELPWVSFQTRESEERFDEIQNEHRWSSSSNLEKDETKHLVNMTFKKKESLKQYIIYVNQTFPFLQLSLLRHSNNLNFFPSEISMKYALDTFGCLLEMKQI